MNQVEASENPHAPARHIPELQRFALEFDGKESFLMYEIDKGNLNLVRTFVPEEQRGHGLAEALVLEAFSFAKSEKRKIIPSCGYVAKYIEKHPEWKKLLAI